MYEQVTAYLGKLKPAHWIPAEKKDDGSYITGWPEYDEITSEFMRRMYEFVPNGGQNYDDVIYKNTGLDCHSDLSKADVSRIDGDTKRLMIITNLMHFPPSCGILFLTANEKVAINAQKSSDNLSAK